MKNLFLAAAICSSLAANAQVSIAPEVGLNYTQLSSTAGNTEFQNTSLISPRLGLNFNLPLFNSSAVYLQPGLFYSGKGGRYEYATDIAGSRFEGDYTFRINYIEIPVQLMVDFDLGSLGGIFIGAGPYVAYGLSGTQKGETRLNGTLLAAASDDVDFGSNAGQINNLDYGASFGAGYRFAFGLYARLQAGIGLANIQNEANTSRYNRGATLSVGYNIRFKNNRSE